jgi:hypothetical protein
MIKAKAKTLIKFSSGLMLGMLLGLTIIVSQSIF